MSADRPSIEDLGAIAALPAEDPRRQAAEADPRVAAQLRAYEEFLAPGPLPDGADLAAAEARLLAALERELGVPLGESPRRAAPVVSRPAGGRAHFLAWLTGPALRPALAVAATLVVVAAAATLLAPRGGREAPNLRGPADGSLAPGAWDARPTAAAGGPGALRLAWSPAAGATRYAVVFLAGDLREVARIDDVTATECMLAADTLPAGLASGQAVLWRVTAYEGADEIGRSVTAPLTVP